MHFLFITLVAGTDPVKLPENIEPQTMTMPSVLGMFMNLAIGLLVIIGLAYVTVKFFRKNMPNTSATQSIVILDQFSMGMNKGLFIADIAGKVYVLGITDHAVNVVTEITDEARIEEIRRLSGEVRENPVWPETWVTWILQKLFKNAKTHGPSFNSHIQEQIKKLQNLGNGKNGDQKGEEGRNE